MADIPMRASMPRTRNRGYKEKSPGHASEKSGIRDSSDLITSPLMFRIAKLPGSRSFRIGPSCGPGLQSGLIIRILCERRVDIQVDLGLWYRP